MPCNPQSVICQPNSCPPQNGSAKQLELGIYRFTDVGATDKHLLEKTPHKLSCLLCRLVGIGISQAVYISFNVDFPLLYSESAHMQLRSFYQKHPCAGFQNNLNTVKRNHIRNP